MFHLHARSRINALRPCGSSNWYRSKISGRILRMNRLWFYADFQCSQMDCEKLFRHFYRRDESVFFVVPSVKWGTHNLTNDVFPLSFASFVPFEQKRDYRNHLLFLNQICWTPNRFQWWNSISADARQFQWRFQSIYCYRAKLIIGIISKFIKKPTIDSEEHKYHTNGCGANWRAQYTSRLWWCRCRYNCGCFVSIALCARMSSILATGNVFKKWELIRGKFKFILNVSAV